MISRPSVVASALLLTLSSVPLGAETGVSDDAVLLGMVNVQTGPASALGKGMLVGASAVFEDVNARGGVHGRAIELLVGDDGYEPERAIDETLFMIEDEGVFSLFGFVGTPTANAVLPIVEELEVPLVGLFTGAGSLREPVMRQVFNVRSSYDDEAEAMVAHFLDDGAENVAVFYQNDSFGKAVLSGTEKALARRDMSVYAKSTFERNTIAIRGGLAEMLEADPDAIVMVGTYAPLAELVRQARAAGLDSRMATVSFVGTKNFVEAVGEAGDGVLITQVMPYPHDDGTAVVEDCRRLIDAHSGAALDYVNLEGCVTAKVMVEGLERAGPDLTRDALIEALEGIRDHDLGGITIDYAEDDHQGMDRIFVSEVREGDVVELSEAMQVSESD